MKKLLLTLCLLALMLSSFSASAKTLPDEAYSVVGGITDIQLDPDGETVTRADFLKLAITAFDLSDSAILKEIYYSDVKESDEIYSYLLVAAGQEMITGSGSFRPLDAISYDEALRICVSALGYNAVIDSYGGYPEGIRKIAARCSLSDGVISGGNVSASDAYKLIYNTLKAPMCMVTSTESGAEFYVSENDTIMSTRLGIFEAEGIMNMNRYTSLGGSDGSSGVAVEISGEKYITDGSYDDLIGMAVKVFYTDEEQKEAVLIIEGENEVVELNTLSELDFDGRELTISEEAKTKRYKIRGGYDYIYNKKSRTDHNKDTVIPEDGTLTLIDNDDDGIYDVIKVRSLEYMKVLAVNKVSGIIKGEKHILETSKGSCTYIIYKDGMRIEPYEILENQILAYSYSHDETVCEVTVCSGEVGGDIGAVNSEEGVIAIGDAEYRFGEYFKNNYLQSIKPGSTVTAYFGLMGEIVAVTTFQRGYSYGYLIRGYLDEFDNRLRMKIYTQSGEFRIFTAVEYIKADGIKCTGEDFMSKYFAEGIKPQLIRYYINTEGMLQRIDLSEKKTELLDMKKVDEDNHLSEYNFGGTYYYRQKTFFPSFHLENTAIFKIPQNIQDEDLFDVNVAFSDGNVTGVTPYDVDISGAAGAIVYKSSAGSDVAYAADNTIILVEKVVKTINEDDDPVNKIYGWKAENGDGVTPVVSFCEYYVDDSVKYLRGGINSEPKRGDVIRVNIEKDTITDVVLDFDGEKRTINTGGTATIGFFNERNSRAVQYNVGSVYSIGDEFMYLSDTKNATGYDYSFDKLINVRIPDVIVLCDSEEKKVQMVDRSYLFDSKNYGSKASYVLVKQHYMYSNFCIIFK